MPVTVGDIVRIAFRQTVGVDDSVNVIHLQVGAVPGLGGDALFMSDISDFAGDLWPLIQSQLTDKLDAVDITGFNVTDDTPTGTTDFGVYTGGTGGGEMLPQAACCMLLMPTTKKRTIGRMYLGPMTEGAQADGVWTGGTIAAVEDFADFLLAPQVGANGYEWQVGIYSRSDGILRFPSSRRVAPVVAYQLRRKPGRGS